MLKQRYILSAKSKCSQLQNKRKYAEVAFKTEFSLWTVKSVAIILKFLDWNNDLQ